MKLIIIIIDNDNIEWGRDKGVGYGGRDTAGRATLSFWAPPPWQGGKNNILDCNHVNSSTIS